MPYLPETKMESESDYDLWLATWTPACPTCGATQEDEEPCDRCIDEFLAEFRKHHKDL